MRALGTSRLPVAEVALPVAAAVAVAGFILLAYATSPAAALIVTAGAAAVALALAAPIAALHLALAAIPLELFSMRVGGTAGISPTEGLLALTGCAWLVRRVVMRQPIWIASPLNAPLALMLVVTAAGLIVAVDVTSVAKITVMWTSFLLVYLMVVAEGDSATVRSLLLVVVAAAAVVAVVALVQTHGQEPQLVEQGAVATGRATGSFTHPNVLAAFFVLSLPVALTLAIGGELAVRPWMGVLFALIVAALVLSLSRGGLLAFGGSLLVMLLWRPGRRLALVLVTAAVATSALGVSPLVDSSEVQLVVQRIDSIRYTGAATGDLRTKLWSTTPAIVADHPLVGIGAGNYPIVSRRYGLLGPHNNSFVHAHNIPLTIAAERGLLGLVALLWATVALAAVLIRTCSRATGSTKAAAIGLAMAFVGFAVKGIVDNELGTNVIAAVILVFAGCAIVLHRSVTT